MYRFRWAQCQIDAIKRCFNEREIEETLISLPEDLDETYERALISTPPSRFNLVSNILLWIAFSERPLTVEELAEAATVEPGQNNPDPKGRLIEPDDILNVCSSLIIVTPEKSGVRHVSLAHYSVKEYLTSDRMKRTENVRLAEFAESVRNAHEKITRTCLTYISFDPFRSESIKSMTYLELDKFWLDFPLLQYSAKCWVKHLKNITSVQTRKQLEDEAFHVLGDGGPRFINWACYYYRRPPKNATEPTWHPDDFAGRELYFFTKHGLDQTVKLVLQHGRYKRGADDGKSRIKRAISIAIRNDDINLARMLLEYSTALSQRDLTKLIGEAILWSSLETVELLFRHANHADLKERHSECLLEIAIDRGDSSIVEALLKFGHYQPVHRNLQLDYACLHAQDNIVLLLLQNGAEVNVGAPLRNPLASAMYGRSESTVQLLVDHGADPCIRGRGYPNGQSYSAIDNAVRIKGTRWLEYLLSTETAQRRVTNGKDEPGFLSSELSMAVMRDNFDKAKLLLQSNADPNGVFNPDDPLEPPDTHVVQWVCILGRLDMLKMLIKHGAEVNDFPVTTTVGVYHDPALDPICCSGSCNSLRIQSCGKFLRAAVRNSHVPLIRFLLQRAPEGFSRRAYAQLGLAGIRLYTKPCVLEFLLSAGADINKPSHGGCLALCQAVNTFGRQNEDMMDALLAMGANPNTVARIEKPCKGLEEYQRASLDGHGTILHFAMVTNKSSVVQKLLKSGAKPNHQCVANIGTPLCVAILQHKDIIYCNAGAEELFGILLDHGGNINLGGGRVPTPLMTAVAHYIPEEICPSTLPNCSYFRGTVELIDFLLRHGAVPDLPAVPYDPFRRFENFEPCTPFEFARRYDCKVVEALLLGMPFEEARKKMTP